jgi:hypothetical protein
MCDSYGGCLAVRPPAGPAWMVTLPFAGVNFSALVSRLVMTWCGQRVDEDLCRGKLLFDRDPGCLEPAGQAVAKCSTSSRSKASWPGMGSATPSSSASWPACRTATGYAAADHVGD